MNETLDLCSKLTVLVNSCDTYEDLWIPFFTLFRKYWGDKTVRVLLNTESKDFALEGLNIECIHCTEKGYSARLRNALAHVQTEYVLVMLDDFFLRHPVDIKRIEQILSWMDNDRDIIYFNSDCTEVYVDWEVDRYPGFRRIPPGSEYVLNLQAAIWRTGDLRRYWKCNVSPWEWEGIVTLQTSREKKKFYCTTDWKNAICDYGYKPEGMGVFRGKWVISDVEPLFQTEGIAVDFSQRGIYDPNIAVIRVDTPDRGSFYNCLVRCLGVWGLLGYLLHRVYVKLAALLGQDAQVQSDYFDYKRALVRRKFLQKKGGIR